MRRGIELKMSLEFNRYENLRKRSKLLKAQSKAVSMARSKMVVDIYQFEKAVANFSKVVKCNCDFRYFVKSAGLTERDNKIITRISEMTIYDYRKVAAVYLYNRKSVVKTYRNLQIDTAKGIG